MPSNSGTATTPLATLSASAPDRRGAGRGSAWETALTSPSPASPRSDESAEPPHASSELGESLQQLVSPKIGPACRSRIVLRVCCLPEQEVAEPHLAAGANDQVEIRQT